MGRVVHFEIYADDPQRAAGFYGGVFGWQVAKWDGPVDYWMVTTGAEGEAGINGGITPRWNQERTVNTVDVDSLDDMVAKVEQAGGRVVAPKRAVPGVGWLAYCVDTEGNTFGLMETDESAAL
jgi:predicted enzyme related to lactoylglutathione lyase